MEKIKVLAVAPYHGLFEQLAASAARHPDFSVRVLEGDLNEGLRLAQQSLCEDSYDFVFSRGGTAELLQRSLDIPVLDISISLMDILQAIRLAQNYNNRFAIVSFQSITKQARLLCQLLQYDIRIETITDEEMLPELLRSLREQGYMMCVGDRVTSMTAKEAGMDTVLITSGMESIENAFEQAKRIYRTTLRQQKKAQLMESIVRALPLGLLVLNEQNHVVLSTISSDRVSGAVINLADTFRNTPDAVIERKTGEDAYTLTCKAMELGGEHFLCMMARQRMTGDFLRQGGVVFQNKQDILKEQADNYYSFAGVMKDINRNIEQFALKQVPIILLGEQGTGKESVAQHLYITGSFSSRPMFTLDFKILKEKQVYGLFKNDDSPLNEIHVTLYLKNVDAMAPAAYEQLIQYMEHAGTAQRCQLIFSFQEPASPDVSGLILSLGSRLSAVTLSLPPLRERREDIASIATLYIGQLNVSWGKQIIGFEPEALKMLTNYDWPCNLDQLHRVLRELGVLTDSLYISAADTQQILVKESISTKSEQTGVNLNQPLDAVTRDIVEMVVAQENGNQTRAAARLEIGRSTIWRILGKNK